MIHKEQARWLGARQDRYSQLLSRAISDEVSGQYLLSKGNLSAAEHAELRSLAPDANSAFRAELFGAILHLRELLARGEPLYIASLVQLSNLFGEWGAYYEPTHQGNELKVELIVGLLATQPPPTTSDPPTDADMQQIYEELDHILQVQFLYNLSMPQGDDPDIATLRHMGTMHWLTMRGTSYGHHGRDLARAVYQPHDEWLLAQYGFTIDDAIQVGEAAESLMNDGMNALRAKAVQFARDVLRELRSNAFKERLPAEIRKRLATKEGRNQMRARALVRAVQTAARPALTFSVDEICRTKKELLPARVEAVLLELSIRVGSVDSSAYTGLFDKSPFLERPFLEFDGRYLLAVPGIMLRDPLGVLERRLLSGKTGFSRARAKVLDRLAVGYLSEMLPGSSADVNLSYEGNELDGLVLFEETAFVVEGKATPLSIPAQRGDLERLRSDIGDAVQEAWVQGARARDFLLRGGDSVFRDSDGNELRIPAGSVSEVIIVNPTLHELAGHAPQLGRLRALGLFPEKALPWSIYINDLRVIAETSENAAIFLHYLVWRNRLPLGAQLSAGDEVDLWASYLLCERFGMLSGPDKVVVGNSSTDFDAYYDGLVGRAPKRKPPTKFLCQPVDEFIRRMATERPTGWREAAGACLDLSIPELGFICAKANELVHQATEQHQALRVNIGRVDVFASGRDEDGATVLSAPYEGDATLVIYCRESSAGRAEILWAKSAKSVTFELSDFEKDVIDRTRARHESVPRS